MRRDRNVLARLWVAVLFAMPLWSNVASAQSIANNPIDDMCMSMSSSILNELKDEIGKHPHLPDIESIIHFTPTIDFSALADTEYKKIYISRAMCQELFRMADASAIMRVAFPGKAMQLTDYAKYLAQQSALANKTPKPGEVIIVDLLRFSEWAKLDLSIVTSDVNQAALAMRDIFLHDALLMIIGHELGHLFNKDRYERLEKYGEAQDTAEKQMSRWREALADKIALKMTLPFARLDGNPASMNALLGLLNRSHGAPANYREDTHPPTICRISYIMLNSGFYEELAKVDIPLKARNELDAFIQQEALLRGVTMQSVADLEKLQKKLLATSLCVDYWPSPLKIYSAAKNAVDVSAHAEAFAAKPDTAPVMIAGLVTEATSWDDMRDLVLPRSIWSCNKGAPGEALTLSSGSQRITMQCRHLAQRLTPEPIFQAITGGRTFLAKYVDPANSSIRQIMVYGVLMQYAGIPRMESVYYVDLDSYLAKKMDASALFTAGSSGLDIGIRK